ncbi:hypothetical protein JAAARDRAFT_499449 [Jaapia argillacea MUCL 33604]|uniref:Uncharacterized protein n=1 Tax=Jaapia argillacea MUCL 33604 TaxID=933084 RepID=A0A067PA41_9AGAM|nr:hypothetical protein JAAARDRAFT_499449 [Jaapia argillacea MUCL 33604]
MAQSAEIRGFGGNILEGLRALLRIDCDYPLPLLTAEQFSTFAESLTLDVKYLSSRMFADPTAPEQLVRWTLSSFWSCAVWNIPMSIASPVPEADLQDLIDSFADAILSSWAEAESWRSYPSAQVNLEGPSPSHIVPGDTLSTLLVFKPDTISVRRRFILACMIFLVYQMRSQGQRWDASPWVGTSFDTPLRKCDRFSWVPSPRLLLLNRGFDLACHMFARTEFCRGLGDVPMLWCRNALLHWLQTGTLPNGAYPFDPTPHSPFGEILHYPRRPRESVRGIQEFIGRWNTMITSRFSLFPDNHPAPIAVNGDSTAFSALRILHTLANMVWIIVFSLGDDSRCLADIEDTTCLVAQLLLRWEEEHTCNAVFQVNIFPYASDLTLLCHLSSFEARWRPSTPTLLIYNYPGNPTTWSKCYCALPQSRSWKLSTSVKPKCF